MLNKYPSPNTLNCTMERKVKVHLDGNYVYHVWLHLHAMGFSIVWEAFFLFILSFIKEKHPDVNPVLDKSISYMFWGDAARPDSQREKLRHELLVAGIDCKRKPLKMVDNHIADGSKGVKEDGIDALNIAHAFYDAFVGAGANTIPTAQYSYLVMFAGDSDFASTFDLLHSLGVKIIVVYFDTDKVHCPTSELIIKQADYAISLESLLYDRGNALAQSIFEPVRHITSSVNPLKQAETTTNMAETSDIDVGTVKFIDARSNAWGIIESSKGYLHFNVSDVKNKDSLYKGCKVQFRVLKRPLPNDGTMPKGMTNGKADEILVLSKDVSIPQQSSVPSGADDRAAAASKLISKIELKELVTASTRENGFALLAEVGAAFKYKFGCKPDRPLKEMLADYPATFEFCFTPAASVRVIA